MTTKQLMQKIEAANEISALTQGREHYGIYVEVDGLSVTDENGNARFSTWNRLAASVAMDWNEEVCRVIGKGDLKMTGDNTLAIESETCRITLQVCR